MTFTDPPDLGALMTWDNPLAEARDDHDDRHVCDEHCTDFGCDAEPTTYNGDDGTCLDFDDDREIVLPGDQDPADRARDL